MAKTKATLSLSLILISFATLSRSFSLLLLHGLFPLRRVHAAAVRRQLALRVQPQLAPHLAGQLGHLRLLQQLHRGGVQPRRRSLRPLPVPRRPRHAGLRRLRRASRPARRRDLPGGVRRRGAARRVLRQVRQRDVPGGGGQDGGAEEVRALGGVRVGCDGREGRGAGRVDRFGRDCVAEAIRRLRTDCGAADYGDVFLAKCYARFSTNGAHAYNKAHGKSGNEGEKTFAIIVGLLAGVAILIIFLAFLRRICEGQGK
ncbi:Cysteine-rich repeat secretory protein 12 [Spatholobus suberectus]|nr:Cysteine-rich repeat secretory protein 12 [Spatholobus suberectus]